MGTWGDGLYDNDSALDTLGDLVDAVDLESDVAHFAAGVGLICWFQPETFDYEGSPLPARIAKRADLVDALTSDAKAIVKRALADPAAFVEAMTRSRRPDVVAVTGGYCSGQRFDALFGVAGAPAVLNEFAAACIERVDGGFERENDLYEIAGEIAPIGLLLELRDVDVRVPSSTVDAWEKSFAACDANTKGERSFWDVYVKRVRPAFPLLRT